VAERHKGVKEIHSTIAFRSGYDAANRKLCPGPGSFARRMTEAG